MSSLRWVTLLVGAHGLNTLVYGPGSGAAELKLLTAKALTAAGGYASVFAGDNANVQRQWSRFLYDAADPEEVDAPGCVNVLSTLEELGECLAALDSLVLICNDAPLEDSVVSTLFNNIGDACARIVYVSRMGVTRAKPPGPFGLGGGDAALLASETAVRAAAESRGAELSVVRVGTLKGGGPGSEALGLTKAYDDSIVDLSAYMTSQAYDKFTLGGRLARGDPFDLANPIVRAGRQGSFDPFDDETSRIVAARAIAHTLARHPSPVEFSVSAAKGQEPPTEEDLARLFAEL